MLIAFAVATLGGISSLLEFFVTPDIRGWNRMSVFIAFFSLLAVALLLDLLAARLRRRRGGVALSAALFAAVLAFGVFDQTSDYFVPDYATDAAEYRSDAAFVAAIQARLPVGAAVFQLPYVPYPEGYPTTVDSQLVTSYATSYEQLRGYVHSTTLRWSYGAMKGRPDDWAAQLAAKPVQLAVPAVAAAGFARSVGGGGRVLAVEGGDTAGRAHEADRGGAARQRARRSVVLRPAALRAAPARDAFRESGRGAPRRDAHPAARGLSGERRDAHQPDAVRARGDLQRRSSRRRLAGGRDHRLPRRTDREHRAERRPRARPPARDGAAGDDRGHDLGRRPGHNVQARQVTLDDDAFAPWESDPKVAGAPPSGLLAPPCVYSPPQ